MSRVRRSMDSRHGDSFKGGRTDDDDDDDLKRVRLFGEGTRIYFVKEEYSYSYRKRVVDQRRKERILRR